MFKFIKGLYNFKFCIFYVSFKKSGVRPFFGFDKSNDSIDLSSFKNIFSRVLTHARGIKYKYHDFNSDVKVKFYWILVYKFKKIKKVDNANINIDKISDDIGDVAKESLKTLPLYLDGILDTIGEIASSICDSVSDIDID